MTPSLCPTLHTCPKCRVAYQHHVADGYRKCFYGNRRDCSECNPPVWTHENGWELNQGGTA